MMEKYIKFIGYVLTLVFVVAGVVPVFAQENVPTSPTTPTTTTPGTPDTPVTPTTKEKGPTKKGVKEKVKKEVKKEVTKEVLACMQKAVVERDTKILQAFDEFSVTVKTAYETRRKALEEAWGIVDQKERRSAITKAWQAFKTTTRKAKDTLNKARKEAWKQFRTQAKTCHPTYTTDDATGEGVDVSL